MNLSEIAPTKTNLLEYKDQLKFATDGHSLLEQKREVLVMYLMDVITKIREQRDRLNELLEKCYRQLAMLEVEIGEFELERIVKGVKTEFEVDIIERSVMGVNIPTIRRRTKKGTEGTPPVSLASTTLTFDEMFRTLNLVVELILVVAQVEVSAWRLAYEVKKTQRRVNALENVFIPDFEEIVKFIDDTLEERERETFFQMKTVKKKKSEEK